MVHCCAGSSREEEEEDMTDGSEGDEPSPALEEPLAVMSASHRTGLAKLPSVIEWLSHALGSGAVEGVGYSLVVYPETVLPQEKDDHIIEE